jgi:hypothetical protein
MSHNLALVDPSTKGNAMSLKQRLFGPAWESGDAETRRSAVRDERDPRLLERLPAIAAEDADPGVRLAALKRLDDDARWLAARRGDADPAVRAQADRALLQHACTTEGNAGTRLEWVAEVGDTDVLRRLAADAVDPAVRRAALARIASQGFLGDRVVAETDNALALAVIERIEQPSTLKRIAKALRKRDKQRHQAVMQRLARIEEDTEDHTTTDELAAQLVERAEKLARGDVRGDRGAEAERLTRRWQELASHDEALTRRFRGALDIVQSALSGRERASAAPAERPAVEPPEASADGELERLTGRAQQLAANPVDDDSAGALKGLLSAFDRRWNAIRRPSDADRALRTRFDALVAELQSRLAPRSAPPPAADETEPAGPDSDRSALDDALDAADRALDSGDVREAHAAVGAARSRLDRWPGKRPPREASARLSRMAARLKEMRDWQHWSNNELRERLIERAEQIDPETLHADAVTARLKELRERWKALDRSEVMPGDTRRFAAPQGQWRRFQKACKQVFETAKPYLERRSELREQSLAELRRFIDEARALLARGDAAADPLIRYQRAARQAIRNLDELPPKRRSRAAAELRALMDEISAALDRCFERVEDEKRRLVAEARKLSHETDRNTAIDRAKALQAEWKRAGRGRRKVEDKLWREFREPIDPLFENLDRERAERREADQQHFEALEKLCRDAESLAQRDDPEAAVGPLAGLHDEFSAHERVPAKLRNRFAAAVDAHRQRLEQQRAARDAERADRLRALAEALQRAGEARMRGEDVDVSGVDEPDPSDEQARRMFERLQQLSTAEAVPDDIDEGTEAARRVVIEMEFLSGSETPESDRQLRMDYQVERLSNRLGRGAPRPDLDSERAALHRRWIDSLPHDPQRHGSLKQRFEAADAILRKMTAQPR